METIRALMKLPLGVTALALVLGGGERAFADHRDWERSPVSDRVDTIKQRMDDIEREQDSLAARKRQLQHSDSWQDRRAAESIDRQIDSLEQRQDRLAEHKRRLEHGGDTGRNWWGWNAPHRDDSYRAPGRRYDNDGAYWRGRYDDRRGRYYAPQTGPDREFRYWRYPDYRW